MLAYWNGMFYTGIVNKVQLVGYNGTLGQKINLKKNRPMDIWTGLVYRYLAYSSAIQERTFVCIIG